MLVTYLFIATSVGKYQVYIDFSFFLSLPYNHGLTYTAKSTKRNQVMIS